MDPRQIPVSDPEVDEEVSLLDLLLVVAENIKLLIVGPILAGLISLGYTSTIPPVFTARTTFLPPMTQGAGGAAAILGQLGVLGGGLGGGGVAPVGKHMAYLDSDLLRDEIIKKYDLSKRWGSKNHDDTRQKLRDSVVIKDDKKTNIVAIEVTDADPKFAAEIANAYVQALSKILGDNAIAEARLRREHLERQITESTRRAYQSTQIRDALIQGLVREFETTRLTEQQPFPSIGQIDVAEPPTYKSGPKRVQSAVIASFSVGVLLLLFVFLRSALIKSGNSLDSAEKIKQIRRALRLSAKKS